MDTTDRAFSAVQLREYIKDELKENDHLHRHTGIVDPDSTAHEVAANYTPLLKRFAKVNTDAIHVGHSVYDVHKELRRSTIITEFIFKTELTTAEVYEDMIDDQGNTLKYELKSVPDTSISYDPDDFAPWEW